MTQINQEIIEQVVKTVIAMRPQPSCVNQKQAAEMLNNMSIPTLKKHIKNGEIKLNDIGMIPIAEINKMALAKQKRNG